MNTIEDELNIDGGKLVLAILLTSEMSAIFVFTTKTTQPRPQLFSVNGALTCKKAVFLTSSVDWWQNFSKFGQQ